MRGFFSIPGFYGRIGDYWGRPGRVKPTCFHLAFDTIPARHQLSESSITTTFGMCNPFSWNIGLMESISFLNLSMIFSLF